MEGECEDTYSGTHVAVVEMTFVFGLVQEGWCYSVVNESRG